MKTFFSKNSIVAPESPAGSGTIEDAVFPSEKEIDDLHVAQCVWADMPNMNLSRVRFKACRSPGCQWRGARLSDIIFESCEFSNADWSEGSLVRALVTTSKAVGWQVSFALFENCLFRDCQLSMLRSIGGRWRRCRFENCDLREAEFEGTTFEDVVFRNCDLRAARFVRADLRSVDLRGSQVDGLVLSPEFVRGATICPEQADVFAAALGLRIEPLPTESM